jgi:ComF family protein
MGRTLDVVFPRRCAGCGSGAWPFCDRCRAELIALAPPWCERCGCPTSVAVPSCRNCPPPPIASARAPFLYVGPARQAVHRLKFTGWRDVAGALAGAIAACDELPSVDIVTWVPLGRRRRSERGYDQARALAVPLGRTLELPVSKLLVRPVATGPQARRRGEDRRTAMRGAFVARGRRVPRRVLLVDDVLTTGATVAACAETLVGAGARSVHVVTAARALRGRGGTFAGHAPPAYPRHGPPSGSVVARGTISR